MSVEEGNLKYSFFKTEANDYYMVKFVGEKYIVVKLFGNKVLKKGEAVFSKETVIKYHNQMTEKDMEDLNSGRYSGWNKKA